MPELDNKQQKHQVLSNGRIRDKKCQSVETARAQYCSSSYNGEIKYKQKLADNGINKFPALKSILVPESDATLSA